jgi:hypothetical protein
VDFLQETSGFVLMQFWVLLGFVLLDLFTGWEFSLSLALSNAVSAIRCMQSDDFCPLGAPLCGISGFGTAHSGLQDSISMRDLLRSVLTALSSLVQLDAADGTGCPVLGDKLPSA